jgi:hypothetical protein
LRRRRAVGYFFLLQLLLALGVAHVSRCAWS